MAAIKTSMGMVSATTTIQRHAADNALRWLDDFVEFLDKIGIDYYCLHDRDVSPLLCS